VLTFFSRGGIVRHLQLAHRLRSEIPEFVEVMRVLRCRVQMQRTAWTVTCRMTQQD
jgi:hypothetical protein